MTPDIDIDRSLRKVSELRRLCLSLPHLSTPAERQRLERFEELVRAPGSATSEDADALATGWRTWWRAQRFDEIASMAERLPSVIVDGDRDVAMFAVAVRTRRET